MTEPLSVMFQQEREHLSQLQNRLLTVNSCFKNIRLSNHVCLESNG
jgi:hypothetical protein